MNFIGRYKCQNDALVAVHANESATPGDREVRYKGHTLDGSVKEIYWNDNAEAVHAGSHNTSLDVLKGYDLKEALIGDKYARAGLDECKWCEECSK